MKTLYHVANKWDGQKLESLYNQIGEEAYEEYANKWPEAAELAQEHAHYVHCYETLEDALNHKQEFGGEVLKIELDEFVEVEIDNLEFAHPMVRDEIDADLISRV